MVEEEANDVSGCSSPMSWASVSSEGSTKISLSSQNSSTISHFPSLHSTKCPYQQGFPVQAIPPTVRPYCGIYGKRLFSLTGSQLITTIQCFNLPICYLSEFLQRSVTSHQLYYPW
uniref:Uncharacterized protein n=1 Tax=Sphaerodactylus townsendi TaxID=933632 RepID=A0ACB8EDH8_9SAUR